MRAYCGLDCSKCPIFLAANDPAKAKIFVEDMKKDGYSNASTSWFVCKGCKGPTSLVYSPKCYMRQCCSEKGLEDCSYCPDLPCGALKGFAEENDNHKKALKYLIGKSETN